MKKYLLSTINQHPLKIAKIIFYLSILFVISIFLSGCKKDLGEYLLGDLKNQNPYSGNETLIFLDNQGDSVVFYGEGRSSYLFETPSSSNPRYYYTNESDVCNFSEQNHNYQLSIYITTRYNSGALMNLIITQIDKDTSKECFSFNSDGYHVPLIMNYENTKLFIDSLNVLNKYYYNVIVDSGLIYDVSYGSSCNNWNKVICLYYTTSYGIIKLEFEDGSSWELENIDWGE